MLKMFLDGPYAVLCLDFDGERPLQCILSFDDDNDVDDNHDDNNDVDFCISGETLCRDNCQLIGMLLIGLARQVQKNRD